MPTDLISLVPPELPGGADYCFVNFQRLAVDIISRTKSTLNTGKVFFWNFGGETPTPDNRIWPWLNTVDGRVYQWSTGFGLWISPYDPPAGANGLRWEWVGPLDGSPSGLWTFDGGDGTDPNGVGTVTATTGSFWTVDTAMSARFSLSAGTLPSGSVVAVGDTGGEEKHVLTIDELPSFTVTTKIPRDGDAPDTLDGTALSNHGDSGTLPWTSDPVGGGLGHNNIPPYYGVAKIKRTGRVWRTLPG